MHTALALETSRVQCGALVYSVGFRHPAVLAKAVTAIDLLSGGRAAIGLGAGWAEVEYDAYGIDFPSVGTRMDQLEECAACVRGLLHDDVTSFDGRWFTLREARNEPRPVQAKLPIWIGGGGERRTLRIAARYADGWNVPFMSPETFGHKRDVLHEHCAARRARPGGDPLRRQRRPGVVGGEPAAPVRGDRRLRPSRRARWFRRRGRRPHRRVRRRRCRSGQPRAARPVRPRRPGALRRRLRDLRLTAHWSSRRCFCSSNSSAVSVPRSRIASRRSSRSITSCDGSWARRSG